MDNKAREINSPLIKQLIDETSPEELAKIDAEMTNNKQQTAVDELWDYLKGWIPQGQYSGVREAYLEAKEMEKERMIKLIQFVVSEKELVDYSSVSNETANYYLDKFNQGGEQ
jgi:hypothetical protein